MARTAITTQRIAIWNIPYSLFMDGVNDGVGFGDVFDKEYTDAFGFSFWFYPRDGETQQTIFQKRNNTAKGWELGFGTNDYKLRFVLEATGGNAVIVDSDVIPINQWSYITASFAGDPDGITAADKISFTRNGESLGTSIVSNQNISVGISNTTNMRWGIRDNNTADYNGGLTDVRFHDADVTLQAAFDAYYNNVHTNVEEHWDHSEGSGPTITGNIGSVVGTLTGGSTWSTVVPMKEREVISTARTAISTDRIIVT